MSFPRNSTAPLVIAGGVAALQSLVLVGLAIADFLDLQEGRFAVGIGIGMVILVLGLGLGASAVAVITGRHVGRGPVIVSQLIGLGLAWNFYTGTGDTKGIAIAIAVSAIVVLGALATKPAREALADRPGDAAV